MATTEQFSLRWNNFHSNLTSGFHELLEAAEMVDVTLAVDGHFFQAHKIVLSICSPYFKQMFKVNPCKHPIVILKDVGHENMKDILEFMYMGEVSVLRENLTQFLRTAELLQVKGLTGDDSSEETSSTKDNKADCDNDEENEMYNQLIETDVELPIYSSSPPQVGSAPPPIKRPSKNSNTSTNSKRSKSEAHQVPQKPVKQEQEPVKSKNEYNSSDFMNVDSQAGQNVSNKMKSEADDGNELMNMKNAWENNISAATSGDLSSSDQDMLSYSTDNKGHVYCPYCCRKFVNRYNLKVHVRDKHEDNSMDLDCQICGSGDKLWLFCCIKNLMLGLVVLKSSFGRSEGFPTQYGPNATPVTVDVLEAGLITAVVILAISFFVALPTTRLKTNLTVFARASITLLIGLLLLVNNFGQEWEVGHINSKTPYRAGIPQEINASISVKIALRGVNVTLTNTTELKEKLKFEKINYNERFEWTWDQGRFGFGPYAGHIQQQFRAAQIRGLPLPILWIVDYFVIDGEGFRFGRFYRTAGWYTHIVMWAAFACWLLAIILFRSVITYGAYSLGLCGILQILANFIWFVVKNPNPLKIPFEDSILKTKYGFNFWATFVTGIVCLILAIVIFYMDYKNDQLLYNLFGVNPLNSYDEVAYVTKQERLLLRPKNSYNPPSDIPLVEVTTDQEDEDVDYIPVYLKRKTIVAAPKINRKNKPKLFSPSTSEGKLEETY